MVAWDDEQEVRVYGFKEVSRHSYDGVVAVNTLPAPSPAQAQERSDLVTLRVRDALATSFERTLFVAATDLAKEIRGVRRLTFSSWASMLDLK
jgi:hypothetical protein